MSDKELFLKYGCNPHQTSARVCSKGGSFPIEVVNGAPGYINLLDAVNSWQLVRELNKALGSPAATSFKHVSPAGAAIAEPLSDELKKAYFVDKTELSPLATAYARARGADRMSSFGDWIALSDTVDVSTAKLINREVSDGVIAPEFEPKALEILRKKKGGKYAVLRIDAAYEPPIMETREVFGIVFEQTRNNGVVSREKLGEIVTENKDLPDSAIRDMIIAQITLKYTQSNSVCFAFGGQVVGIGAGQQSRIHCTRLAAQKTATWWLRQHPATLNLNFGNGVKRPDMNNAVDQFLRDDLTPAEEKVWRTLFNQVPTRLSKNDKDEWTRELKDIVLASDGFFPFRDNIDFASQFGVKHVIQPGGSIADKGIVEVCNEYDMVMLLSGLRLFHH